MILSAPSLAHTPSCLDENGSADSDCVCLPMHFAIKWHETLPTAIGLAPPFKFFKAITETLQKTGVTETAS